MSTKLVAVLICVPLAAGPSMALGQLVEEENSETVAGASDGSIGEPSLDLPRVAEMIVQQTNDFRKQHGPAPVEVNPQLKETAEYFAEYMARTDRYGHTADGQRPAQRAKQHDYEYCIVSENIAYAYRSTRFTEAQLAEKFAQGWKNSPEHRENMLDPDVTETGVAVAHSEKPGNYYAVQMFGRPKSLSITFSVANRSDAAIQYELGDRVLPLPPRYTRTHEQCRPSKLKFQLTEDGGQAKDIKTVQPESGQRFVITGQSGRLKIQESQ